MSQAHVVGRLIVLSAPSGTGKSTVCRRLVEEHGDLAISISYTTRAPRGAERDGVEYHFVDDAAFDELVAGGELLEWAAVHGRRYGTHRGDVERLLSRGIDVLFDIDVQGGQQIKRARPDALLIFLLPPSLDDLLQRLAGRGTETPEAIARRMRVAAWELEQGRTYDCHVINRVLEEAVAQVERLRRLPLQESCSQRVDELLETLLLEAGQKFVQ